MAIRSERHTEPVFNLSAAHGHREVGHERVLGLAGTVGDDETPARPTAEMDGGDSLGHGADLVEFDQRRIAGLLLDRPGDEAGVGDQVVVADDLDLVAQRGRHALETVPVVLGVSVLDGDNGIFRDPGLEQCGHFPGALVALAAASQPVLAVFKEGTGRRIEGYGDVAARLVTGRAMS